MPERLTNAPSTSPAIGTISNVLIGTCAILAASLAVFAVYSLVAQPLTGIDDANIFLTYATNLSQGHGFVYYDGGERVEGFTSLAWVLVCALAVGLTGLPEFTALVACTLGLGLCLWGVSRYVAELLAERSGIKAPLAGMVFVAGWMLLTPKYVLWMSITLMDAGLWSLVLTLGTLSAARSLREPPQTRRGWRVGMWMSLLLITRPEGMLIGLAWLASLAAGSRLVDRHRDDGHWLRDLGRRLLLPTLAYVTSLSLLTGFRLLYFGYALPNTYYAKVSPDRLYNLLTGMQYAGDYLAAQPLFCVPLVAAVGFPMVCLYKLCRGPATNAASQQPDRGLGADTVVAMSLLAGALGPVLTGGDHFAMFRFYQPLWPLAAVTTASLVCSLLPARKPRSASKRRAARINVLAALYLLAAANAFFQSSPWFAFSDSMRIEFELAREGRDVGQLLNTALGPDPRQSIGVTIAGGLAYRYRGPVVDMMGLNNVAMGHSPGDRRGAKNHASFNRDVFFQLAPDLVMPRLVKADAQPPQSANAMWPARDRRFWNRVTGGLFENTEFRRRYLPAVLSVRVGRLDGQADNRLPGNESTQSEMRHVVVWCRQENCHNCGQRVSYCGRCPKVLLALFCLL